MGEWKLQKVYYYQVSSKHNTKVINILHDLGHGVSYSILSEMHTGNAFFILKQQSDEVILPINTAIEPFTICVLDNDDRNKETWTGNLNLV